MRCGEVIQDLYEDYDWLCRNGAVGSGDAVLFQVRRTPEYQDFAAKFHWMRGMLDLYHTLQVNGIETYLVSASPAELVRAGSEQIGLGVPPERIFAMRGLRDEAGRYCCAYDYDWLGKGRYAQTFGPEKSRVISRFIAPLHGGKGPLLVCGDAESDMDMMTDWMGRGIQNMD